MASTSKPDPSICREPDDSDFHDCLMFATQRPAGIKLVLDSIYERGRLAGVREMLAALREARAKVTGQ